MLDIQVKRYREKGETEKAEKCRGLALGLLALYLEKEDVLDAPASAPGSGRNRPS